MQSKCRIRPTVALIFLLIAAIIITKVFLYIREDIRQASIGDILQPVRAAIRYQETNAVLKCMAPADTKIALEQLINNQVASFGPCKGLDLPPDERRFFPGEKIPANPYNKNSAIVLCQECAGPCDSKCLSWATLQYAGWCFDPAQGKFWPASNQNQECSL